ncbi:hypothetical protein FKM82_028517 [Ascaphus truei]
MPVCLYSNFMIHSAVHIIFHWCSLLWVGIVAGPCSYLCNRLNNPLTPPPNRSHCWVRYEGFAHPLHTLLELFRVCPLVKSRSCSELLYATSPLPAPEEPGASLTHSNGALTHMQLPRSRNMCVTTL